VCPPRYDRGEAYEIAQLSGHVFKVQSIDSEQVRSARMYFSGAVWMLNGTYDARAREFPDSSHARHSASPAPVAPETSIVGEICP